MEIVPFSDYRPSMAKNVLLVNNPLGHTRPTTYTLPDEEFRYGIRTRRGESVADCFDWPDPPRTAYRRGKSSAGVSERSLSPPRTARRELSSIAPPPEPEPEPVKPDPECPKAEMMSLVERTLGAPVTNRPLNIKTNRDFISTNKAALDAGCVTARDFREFKEENYIATKQKTKNGQRAKRLHEMKVRNMVHGISTPVHSEMKDCLTYKTLNDALDRAVRTRELQALRTKAKTAKKPTFKKASRSTCASRGHTVKPPPPPSEADTFKMKKFKDIDHYKIVDYWE